MQYNSERLAFGQYLRTSRQEAGITQKELSSRLGYASSQFVSNWERGLSFPAPNNLSLIADVLGIGVGEIIDALVEEKTYRLRQRLERNALANSRP